MSAFAMEALKMVGGPIKSLLYNAITEYVAYIFKYGENMDTFAKELKVLCAKKLDLDDKVRLGKNNGEKIKREAANWLENVQELTSWKEFKTLLIKGNVVEVAVKMMEQEALKKLLKEDKVVLGIVVKLLEKDSQNGVHRRAGNSEEDGNSNKVAMVGEDYKKVAQVVEEVMKDTSDEFKKLLKEDLNMTVAAMKMMRDEDLENLKVGDKEMTEMIKRAEAIIDKEALHYDHGEDELLIKKHEEDVEPANKNVIRDSVWKASNHLGNLLVDDKILKDLPDEAKLALGVMTSLIHTQDLKERMDNSTQRHRYCHCCAVRFEHYHDQHDLSLAAETMNKEINKLIAQCPQDQVTRPKRRDELEGVPSGFSKSLESREEILQEVIKTLKDDKVSAVGICGMGGSGKTTLAKEVVSNIGTNIFEKIVMVEVSQTPNIERIQDQIAESLGMSLHDLHSATQRAIKIYNVLKQEEGQKEEKKEGNKERKKNLIILDNIWQKLNLEEAGIPRESCKLLLTSREGDVCKTMGVHEGNLLKVDLLKEKEARILFQRQIEQRVDSGESKSVVDRLMNKCGGLPLAIVTTAYSLKGKKLSAWQQFADELEKPISGQVRGVHSETYAILKTSYEVMESEDKKMFFLLACLSPIGSSISIENLMRYGIGLHLFQHVNNLSEAMEQAKTWAEELVSSSMLLKGDSDDHVKIHDVVRDSTLSFVANVDAEKERHNFLVEAIPRWMHECSFNKYSAISLSSSNDYSRLDGVMAIRLHTLILKGKLSFSSKLSDNFFQGMTNLKVLALSKLTFEPCLPSSSASLEKLSTLHLESCRLGDIQIIGNLMNLNVLSLRESVIKELPVDEIKKLYNLRLLDMGGCRGKQPTRLAEAIVSLSNLEGVYLLDSYRESLVATIKSDDGRTCFSKLPYMKVLEVHVPELDQLSIDSRNVKNLSQFALCAGGQSPKNLKQLIGQYQRVLMLQEIDITRIVKDICLKALLNKADYLEIRHCKTPKNVAPDMDEEGLKCLSSICVDNCEDVETLICREKMNDFNAFPNLETLSLFSLPNLKMICDGEAPPGTFLNLREINLVDLKELKYVLPFTPSKLTMIIVSECRSLESIFKVSAHMASERDNGETEDVNMIELPCLRELTILLAANLRELVQAELFDSGNCEQEHPSFFGNKVKFPSLEMLNLGRIDKIVKLWSKGSDTCSFQNLKIVTISKCEGLKSMGPPSVFSNLLQLEILSISCCEVMKEVIAKETEGGEIPDQVIRFPQLKELKLVYLMNLQSFYAGSYKLEFLKLEKLHLSVISSMITFAVSPNSTAFFPHEMTFPCLEELVLDQLHDEIKHHWKRHLSVEGGCTSTTTSNPFPKLRKLVVGNLPLFVSQNISCLHLSAFNGHEFFFSASGSTENDEFVWTYSQLSKLEELSVNSCDLLVRLFENEDNSTDAICKFGGQLKRLSLKSLRKLEQMSLLPFKNLVSLHLQDLRWKYVFSADMLIRGSELLPLLEDLTIFYFKLMELVIQDKPRGDAKDRVISFPRLKTLNLWYLDKAISFSSQRDVTLRLPSLETLNVLHCSELEAFWSGSFVAPKLREVDLKDCSEMQWFLTESSNQQVVDLQSLQRVKISACPKMQGFITGYRYPGEVLELPSLRQFKYNESPNVQCLNSGALRAPELAQVKIDKQEYSIQEVNDINHFLASRYRSILGEREGNPEEGSSKKQSEGEIEEEH